MTDWINELSLKELLNEDDSEESKQRVANETASGVSDENKIKNCYQPKQIVDRLVSVNEIDHLEYASYFLTENYDHNGELSLRWWRERFWVWNGQRYREINDSELKAEIFSWLHKGVIRPKHTLATGIVEAVKSRARISSEVEQPAWLESEEIMRKNLLSMKNGILDIDVVLAGQEVPLIPSTPKWFSTVAVDYAYNPSATCPVLESHLELCLSSDPDCILLVQEFFGYCLTHDTSLNKMMLWEGEGANGKSVTSEVLRQMVGPDNCSTVPLERFGDRFQLTPSLGKLVNICSDVGELDKTAEGVLKQFTSGDPMQFDRKGLSPISAKPTAKLLLSTNNRPRIHDRSKGLFRRLLFIRWNKEIPLSKQNSLYAQCASPNWPFRKELPGILNFALAGLKRLRENNRFSEPESSSLALREYQRESNPARTFLEENYEYNPIGKERIDDVMESYQEMCRRLGYHPLAEAQFGREIRRVFPQIKRIRPNRCGERYGAYEGLLKRSEADPY